MPNMEAISDPRWLERRLEQIEAQVNVTPPSHGGALTTPGSLLTLLTNKTIGASQTTIAHGQSYIPKVYAIVLTSAGQIWRSAASDATNIYLTADAAGRTCDVVIGR